jgi:hypothetical protein
MKRACDVTIHLFNFKQLDTFCEGSYKLRFSILSKTHEIEIEGSPYLLPVNSESALKGKFFITKVFTPESLHSHPLNEMCTFRVEVPYLEDILPSHQPSTSKSEVTVKVELLMYGLGDTTLGKKYPANSEGFSLVGTNVLYLRKIWKGVHEYTEVNFHDVMFCTASLAIHSNLVNYKLDVQYLRPSLKGESNKPKSGTFWGTLCTRQSKGIRS